MLSSFYSLLEEKFWFPTADECYPSKTKESNGSESEGKPTDLLVFLTDLCPSTVGSQMTPPTTPRSKIRGKDRTNRARLREGKSNVLEKSCGSNQTLYSFVPGSVLSCPD